MNKKVGDLLNYSNYFLHKKSIRDYSYSVLFENWPDVTRKLGIKEEFEKPFIEAAREVSEYEDGIIMLSLPLLVTAYKGKKIKVYGLEIECKDALERDTIHECVHHVQNNFYNIDLDHYSCATEGLAELVSIELLLEKGKYNLAAADIAEYFMETKKSYKDYFGLPKEYNKHIERVIKDESYKPPERDLYYAKGFLHICENYRGRKSYLSLLHKPFKNYEVDKKKSRPG